MSDAATAQAVFDTLLAHEMTHVIGVPDNDTAGLFALAADHPDVELLTVTREGEAFAVASGLWLGGKEPVVVIQNPARAGVAAVRRTRRAEPERIGG